MKAKNTEVIMSSILIRIEKFIAMLDENKVSEVKLELKELSDDICNYGYKH